MVKVPRVSCLILLGLLTGCGGGTSTTNPGSAPPHHGNLIALPGGKGYVEIVQKEAGSAKSTMSAEVSFYLINQSNEPLSPAPAAGTLTIGEKKIDLKPEGEALVTPTGPPLFPKGGLDGVLSVELEGKSINIPLGIR